MKEKAAVINEETEVKQPSGKAVSAEFCTRATKPLSDRLNHSQQMTKPAESKQEPETIGSTVNNAGKEIKQTIDLNSSKMTETADTDSERVLKNLG
ncbi:MAG: hypothetical protein U5K84_11055 [Alkalibacterium sp.]|nr:hypothetical protein [Alkalibacterium sp.]